MSHKQAKSLRKKFREAGVPISAEPYSIARGTIFSSKGRRTYKKLKRMSEAERSKILERSIYEKSNPVFRGFSAGIRPVFC